MKYTQQSLINAIDILAKKYKAQDQLDISSTTNLIDKLRIISHDRYIKLVYKMNCKVGYPYEECTCDHIVSQALYELQTTGNVTYGDIHYGK